MQDNATPPTATGALARREARLAWAMLAPTIIAISLLVILPLLAVFWISVKPISLADLRAPAPVVREMLRGDLAQPGDSARLQYRVRNSSQQKPVTGVVLRDVWPQGLVAEQIDPRCQLSGVVLQCALGDLAGGQRETLTITVRATPAYFAAAISPKDSPPEISGRSDNVLLNATFTLDNFRKIFDGKEFVNVLWVTSFYTIVGTFGALIVGLLAALLLNKSFRGQGVLRGLYLFPYVAPVIAVAFTWIMLFDPYSGSANALLV